MTNQIRNSTFLKNKIHFICLVSILICIPLYFKINSLIDTTKEDLIMQGYFVNSSGCRIPALNPFSKNALLYFHPFKPKKCFKMQFLEARTERGQNYLVLSKPQAEIIRFAKVEKISDIRCNLRDVQRKDDNSNSYTKTKNLWLKNQEKQIRVSNGFTIIRVECFGNANESIYHDVHFFLPHPQPIRHDSGESQKNPRLSVMVLGIDSISHMQFIRSMPLLAAYIKTLSHIEFWGYNRVGRNTYPNLVPLFSGLNETELEKDCYTGERNYDKCNFIWNFFKQAGYNTSYGEDNSVVGTFNYGKLGFGRQPTDFYLRPVMLEVNTHTRYSIDENQLLHCTGNRKFSDLLHEFIYKLIPHLKTGPHFSIFWEAQGVHDYYNYPKLLDKVYLRLLKRLRSHHIMSNTLILLSSDHGLRFGSFRNTKQGMLEESQPLLIALYPKWLEEEYPMSIANLRQNAHSLITTFDLHETLKDLVNLELLKDSQIEKRSKLLREMGDIIPRGISLFLPVPEHRDCRLARIPDAFCQCYNLRQLSPKDDRSRQAANFIMQNLNGIIESYPVCQEWQLIEIKDAFFINKTDYLGNFEVKARVHANPGKALFEGTVTFSGSSLTLNGPILRINRYGNQSHCINNYHIEMYCYC